MLAYVISIDELLKLFSQNPLNHLGEYSGLLIFSGIFYFIFAFFREQVCAIACPYGRLQGVLIDKKSIIVAYDHKRGEPRGPLKLTVEKNLGDCINCNSCVTVCPAGIDIKNGTQMECINCTACIDACDTVMDRIKKPRGLIRYDSEDGIETGHHSIFNIRSIAYSVVLTILMFFVASLFFVRGDFEVTILRQRGSSFQKYGTDSISNIYTFQIVNKIRKPINITIKSESLEGRIQYIGPNTIIEKGEIGKGTFMFIVDKSKINSSNTPIEFGIYTEEEHIENYKSNFVGPNSLDKIRF